MEPNANYSEFAYLDPYSRRFREVNEELRSNKEYKVSDEDLDRFDAPNSGSSEFEVEVMGDPNSRLAYIQSWLRLCKVIDILAAEGLTPPPPLPLTD